MSQKASLSAIGGFVLIALLLVVATVFYFGSGRMFRTAVHVVAFFPGSIQGIATGSPVEFRGVKVGEVTRLNVIYSRNQKKAAVAVYMKLWLDTVETIEKTESADSDEYELKEHVEKFGLKARLATKSYVTGQQAVTLDFLPDAPIRLVGLASEKYQEIPTVETTLDRLGRELEHLDLAGLTTSATGAFVAIEKLVSDPSLGKTIGELQLALQDARKMIENAGGTLHELRPKAANALDQAGTTLKTADDAIKKIQPPATDALNQIRSTMKTAQDLIDEDSGTRHNLDEALIALARAAEAVGNLAQYINQNPDAFLRGRNP